MRNLPRNLTFVFAVLTLSASPAFSCTCAPKPSVARAFSQSDAVFVGRVIAWHNANIEFAPGHSFSDCQLRSGTVLVFRASGYR